MVMDAGMLKEFDHPFKLLQNTESIFYGMVQQTGRVMSEALYNIAKESYSKIDTIDS